MKKLKRFAALVLTLCLITTMLPTVVFAENIFADIETSDEYIYNSDLFFGYSTYLTGVYNYPLQNLELHRLGTTMTIIQDYTETTDFMESVISQGLSIATDPAGTAKYFTDYIGLSSFQFNDELDQANIAFVEELCKTNLVLSQVDSIVKENNKYIKKMNSFLKAVKEVDEAGLLDEEHYSGLSKPEVYTSMYEQTIAYYQKYFTQIDPSLSFNTQLYTALSEMTAVLGDIKDAADFTHALCLSLMMQDAQLELIQDVINTQPSNSTLYKGMTRLKNQLQNGWVSYFIDTFVKEKVYDELADGITEKIGEWILGNWTSYYSAVTAVVNVVNIVVFEWALGVHYSEYRTAVMLDTYAADLCNSVKNKALVFQNAGFSINNIAEYEVLFNAYIAMSEASLRACSDLAVEISTDSEKYLDEQLKLYDNDNIYSDYINDVKAYILNIPAENRMVTNYGYWELTSDTYLSEGSDVIEPNYIYAVNNEFNGIIKAVHWKSNAFTVLGGNRITINGDLDMTTYSDVIVQEGAELTVNGDFYHICYDESGSQWSTFYNYGTIKVNGNVLMNGAYNYYFGGFAYENFWNYGTLDISGNLILDETNGMFNNYGTVKVGKKLEIRNRATLLNRGQIYGVNFVLNNRYNGGTFQDSYLEMDYVSASICLTGDFLSNVDRSGFCNIINGTVVFNGEGKQTIKNLFASTVINENHSDEGLEFSEIIKVTVLFDHRGNKFTVGGGSFVDYDGDGVKDHLDPQPTVKNTFVTVSYNANGGTGEPTSQSKACNINLTLSEVIPTRMGYTFLGWATSSTATNISYFPGGIYSEDSDVTLYAVWELNSVIEGNCGENVNWELRDGSTLIIRGTGSMEEWEYYTNVPWYEFITYIKEIIIEDGVSSIGSYAFYNCKELTSVRIADSVTVIGNFAFYNCAALIGIEIPDGVTTIGDSAFYNCDGFTSIMIPDSVTIIDMRVFRNCSNLQNVTMGNGVLTIGMRAFHLCKSLTSITIPDGVTTIERETFKNCTNLQSVEIPKSITRIRSSVFGDCESLTDVYYNGTAEDWEEISIEEQNETLLNATIHFAACDHTAVENSVCINCGETISLEIKDSEGNVIGYYTTLIEALTAVTKGQTLILQADIVDGDAVISSGVNLDLNGHTFTADSLLTFSTSSIIDTSESVSGLLKINDADGNMISPDNAQLPVYDDAAGGYRFFAIDVEPCAVTGGNKYWFKIKAEKFTPMHELICADADVQIKVKMTWDGQTDDTYAAADLAFTKDWANSYNANEDIYITVSVAEAEGTENFKLIPMITSGGVEITGEEM